MDINLLVMGANFFNHFWSWKASRVFLKTTGKALITAVGYPGIKCCGICGYFTLNTWNKFCSEVKNPDQFCTSAIGGWSGEAQPAVQGCTCLCFLWKCCLSVLLCHLTCTYWQLEKFLNFGNPKLHMVLENHCWVTFSLAEIQMFIVQKVRRITWYVYFINWWLSWTQKQDRYFCVCVFVFGLGFFYFCIFFFF